MATEGGEGIPKAAVESEDPRGALVSAPVSTDGHPRVPLKISFSTSSNIGSSSTLQSGDQDGDAIKCSISSDVLSGDCADDFGQRGGEAEEQQLEEGGSAKRLDSFGSGVESSGRSFGKRGGEAEEQQLEEGGSAQRLDSFGSGVESSGRSFGKRISTMGMNISKRVSDGLSHDADLQCLGFKSEISDTAMFARGVVQIIRALHCFPCRRAQVERIQFSRVNLWFLKLYHNQIYRRLMYTNLALLIFTPMIGFNTLTSEASVVVIGGFDSFARICTPLSILAVFIDITIKCLAYGELAYYSPQRTLFNLDREVVSTHTMIFCNFFLLFQYCNFGWRPELPRQTGVMSVFVRTPLFRSVLVLARSHNLQHDILSKMYSLRKSVPIILMSLAIFLVLCIGLTVLIGVVIVPDMRMASFYKSSSDTSPEQSELMNFNFNTSSPDTQNLVKIWNDELDSSFKSIFRTMMTLFIGMTYSNYYKIFRLIWDNAYGSDINVIRSIPRVVASVFLSFFGVFVVVMDCIIVAVCVNAFAEHRSQTAEYSMKQEIANLESAFDFLCMSANKNHITKDMWMEILLASGRKFTKKRNLDDEFVKGIGAAGGD
ncbi:hypothetical protein TrCOL_g345 [Triparma columacea]|uniref:Ion transport domain-containing protein n=1 Tax=Triparma columacea TaxID=722753 RepID=A0A9W7GIP8_9STRA|nr:hypothetical protein TrCOL_g345 [Triparma columacea]